MLQSHCIGICFYLCAHWCIVFNNGVFKMTDISALKRVKVPLWAVWLGRYRARKRRKAAAKEWNYIATVFTWGLFTGTAKVFKRWYILSESGTGKRKFEFGSNYSHLVYCEDSEYARIIVPWIHGRWTNQQMKEYAAKSEKCPIQ